MSQKRRVSGISDTAVMLGVGAVVLYLVLRKPTTPPVYSTVLSPGTVIPSSASTTNTAITAGASIVNNLFNQLFG